MVIVAMARLVPPSLWGGERLMEGSALISREGRYGNLGGLNVERDLKEGNATVMGRRRWLGATVRLYTWRSRFRDVVAQTRGD